MTRRTQAAALAAVAVLTAGCGSGGFQGLYGVPLPGGADLGERPIRVTAQFADVLDLVPQAGVKVKDAPVGRVDTIDLAPDGRTAMVTMLVDGDVVLTGDVRAELRQSSLLGEKFVELSTPRASKSTERLADGAVIPVERTNRNPEIEEALGALSLLLNGGGLDQIQTIAKELDAALAGNEPRIRSLLSTVERIARDLDGQKADIARAIDALNRVSGVLAAQRDDITTTLDSLAPGLRVLSAQRDQLVTMLGSLDTLSQVSVDTIHRSKDDLVADLRALAPTVHKLAETGQNLPKALEILGTFPFTDYSLNGISGDYFNADMRVDLDLSRILDNIGSSSQPLVTLPALPVAGPASTPSLPGISVPEQVSGLPGLLDSLLGVTP